MSDGPRDHAPTIARLAEFFGLCDDAVARIDRLMAAYPRSRGMRGRAFYKLEEARSLLRSAAGACASRLGCRVTPDDPRRNAHWGFCIPGVGDLPPAEWLAMAGEFRGIGSDIWRIADSAAGLMDEQSSSFAGAALAVAAAGQELDLEAKVEYPDLHLVDGPIEETASGGPAPEFAGPDRDRTAADRTAGRRFDQVADDLMSPLAFRCTTLALRPKGSTAMAIWREPGNTL